MRGPSRFYSLVVDLFSETRDRYDCNLYEVVTPPRN